MMTDFVPRYDLEYLNYGLVVLEDYLLSDELFWPVVERPSEGGTFLKVTLGNLLFSLKRLEAMVEGGHLELSECADLNRIQAALHAVQTKWRVAWEEKAGREFRSRFNQYANLLRDIKKDYEKQAPFYAQEVRLRVLLELLKEHAAPQEGYDLDALDAVLRGFLRPADFIWDRELDAGFPTDNYWYLYGTLGE